MPCDTRVKRGQTLQQRATEVRDVVARIAKRIVSGQVRIKVGPTGGVALEGVTEAERDDVTDACIYRRVMATGSVLEKMAFQRAEQLAGRSVDRQSLAHGHHSHDGGHTWHHHKG
jgi:hypothetical protein